MMDDVQTARESHPAQAADAHDNYPIGCRRQWEKSVSRWWCGGHRCTLPTHTTYAATRHDRANGHTKATIFGVDWKNTFRASDGRARPQRIGSINPLPYPCRAKKPGG